jgi:glutathione S-transferase
LLNEVAAQDHIWFNAPTVSILDLYVAATLRWAQIYPAKDFRQITLDPWPNLRAMVLRLETRASVAALIQAEGLGDTPFSDPKNFYLYQSETA